MNDYTDPNDPMWEQRERKLLSKIEALRAALGRLVRKGDDGVWRTTQNGDADVSAIVGDVLEQDVPK